MDWENIRQLVLPIPNGTNINIEIRHPRAVDDLGAFNAQQ
jgi:hypothetical protein